MGGTAAIVAGLTRLLEETGVELRLGEPVVEIEVERGRARGVRTERGERIAADLVVANADPSRVYSRMIDARHRRRHTDRAVRRTRQSMSLFVAYFGSRKQFPELAHHTIVLGDRYRGLLDDIFRRRVLADDFSLYLHAPTRTDPSLAPAGEEAFYVLSPVPNNRSGIDWGREAEPYFHRIMEALERRLLPGVGASPVEPILLTPDDFEHTLRSEDGAAFGPEPLLTQSAYFRYHNRSPDVDGLFFVGAGTHPGGGVPGVLSSAKVLDRLVPPAPHPAALAGVG
jgi:phytoene desaturase